MLFALQDTGNWQGSIELSNPGVQTTWFIFLYFQDALLFCRQKNKMKDATSISEKKDVYFPLVTKDGQFEQSILILYEN